MPFGIDEKVWRKLVNNISDIYNLDYRYLTFHRGEIAFLSYLYHDFHKKAIYLPFYYEGYKINSDFNG